MSQHPEIPLRQVDAMFNAMDQSHSGEVDYTEFLAAAIMSQTHMDAPSVSTVFGRALRVNKVGTHAPLRGGPKGLSTLVAGPNS